MRPSRRMIRTRVPKRVSASTVAGLAITVDGRRALRDVDLAALFGISLPVLYQRIGGKLWRFKPSFFCKLPKRYARGRLDVQPALAFTWAGVIMVAGILGDDASLEIGMDIAHALKNQRRASARKQPPLRRADDSDKAARYCEAKARLLQSRLHLLLNETQQPRPKKKKSPKKKPKKKRHD